MTIGTDLFLGQVREAQQLNMGIVTMPTYHEPRMSNHEANVMPWHMFEEGIQPIHKVESSVSDISYLLTPKNLGWGVEDVTIFAGEEDRQIDEIDDLTDEEGREFFTLNSTLAQALVQEKQTEAVSVAIGFNPYDFSISHHSIQRLHSHVRTMPHEADLSRRTRYTWRQLDRFDRLAFIEPFADLYHDYITEKVGQALFSGHIIGAPERRLGYTSLAFEADSLSAIYPDLKRLYVALKGEYENVAAIFTDGTKDPLDRYVPRPLEDRKRLLADFLLVNRGVYSERSKKILAYLGEHLLPAEARDPGNPRDMSTMGKVYATRGFAGAFNFTFDTQGKVRMDFLPRVITTSGITKTIMGDDLPGVIAKTKSPATAEERAITRRYHERLLHILGVSAVEQNKDERALAWQS